MTHLVKYTNSEGHTGEHEIEELQDAIAHVERLRNEQGVASARIFRIEEIAFEFKPYYRVELGGSAVDPASGSRGTAAAGSPAEPAPAPLAAETAAEDAAHSAAGAAPAHSAPADAVAAEGAAPPMIDPWADAPPPPPFPANETPAEAEPVSTGRRGLFSR